MPSLLGVDAENHIIALQDLGEATDCTFLYQKGNSLTGTEVEKLVAFLNELHAIPFDRLTAYPDNYTLRKLNCEHLFQFPFMRDNGFDLNGIQQGLQELAVQYKTDPDFVKRVKKLGSNYLSRGTSLLHGDYYPGSWLKTKTDLKIIDPEFSFVGNREFDVGVFISHLKMARSSEALIAQATSNYQADRNFNWDLCYQFAGVETMRRIIGLAQLPMDLTLQEKEILLNEAHSLI